LKRLVLVPDDFAEISFDLNGDLKRYRDKIFKLKEGASYKIKLEFYVQRDIISGLKLVQSAYKGPIRSIDFLYLFMHYLTRLYFFILKLINRRI
jgi:hypothetical protein